MGKIVNALNCAELKAELNRRGLPTAGTKNDLIIRLQENLRQHGENPDTFLFEIEMSEDQVSTSLDITNMMAQLLAQFEDQRKEQRNLLEEQRIEQKHEQKNLLVRLEEQKSEQKNLLEEQRTEQKNLLEEQRSEQKKLLERQEKNLLERFEEQKHILEGKLDLFENKFVALDERVEKQFSSVETKFEKIEDNIESITKELEKVRKMKVRESSGNCPKRKEMHPPTFDGQTSWSIYKKQFEAAATTNGWDDEDKFIALTLALRGSAAELLQTIPADQNGNFSALVQAIDKRFGDDHMQEVFRVQLNTRVQKRGESLQQLQADIERLAHLAYPTAGDEITNQLATEAFVRAVSDINLQRAIRTAGKRTLSEALAFALTMEASEQASLGVHRVRELEVEECSCQRAEFQGRQREGLARCWNCNKTGHLQRQCRLPPRRVACQHCGSRNNTRQQVSNNISAPARPVFPVGKRVRTNFEGQKLVSGIDGPRTTIQVSQTKRNNKSLTVDTTLNGKKQLATIDTGATASIVRRDLVKMTWLHNTNSYRLKTATGEAARVYGEVRLKIRLAELEFSHLFLVADICDECIIGIDFMKEHGLILDIGKQVLKYQNVEIPMVYGNKNSSILRTVIKEDICLPPSSEVFVWTKIEGDLGSHRYLMVEPETEQSSQNIILGKTLVEPKNNMVPVRILNIKPYEVKLRKGEIVGKCESVSAITKITEMNTDKSIDPEKFSSVKAKILKSSDLSQHQLSVAGGLLHEYADIFSSPSGQYGRTQLVQHRIDTGDARPIRQPARRLPLAKQTEVEEMISTMKKDGLIENSKSPWASPVVLVKKKDGSTRFCVDYRRLNDVTKKDSYPLPRISDTLDAMEGAQWFSTLDLKSGYWQVEIHPEDREKTAFSTGNGLWQFKVMPFGLCNAPATFERLMECVLQGLTWKSCLVYLDDVIVYGKNFDEHCENLKAVFQRLREAHLKLNPDKCALFKTEVKYLGHIISSQGVYTDPEKVDTVKNWPTPQDKHQLRSFLGLATYYRRFVKDFAGIAKSLHQLTEKGKSFKWSGECEKSFQELKLRLCNAPVLTYPIPDKPFIIDADASNVGIGAVLSQVHDGEEKVVAYYSKVLSRPERNYCVTRRELLALILATKHFHKYIYGQKFLLRTDHGALSWLLNFKNPEGQVARWIERLQTYDYQIQHRRGKLHSNADALSRRPCKQDCKHCTRQEEKEMEAIQRIRVDPIYGWSNEELRTAQQEDSDIEPILAWKEHEEKPEWSDISDRSPALKAYWAQWDSLHVKEGVLMRKWESADGKSYVMQVIVPGSKVNDVLREMHDGASGGHLGVNKTLEKIRQRFYWLHARDDIEKWCRKCDTCAATKGPGRKQQSKMQQYNVGTPFERIAVDIAGPFPETNSGNRYILVVMDYFSKWPEAFAIPNQEAKTVVDQIVFNWVSRFGVPLELHSDQGRNFESNIFQEVCSLLGIKKTRTTPLHPQSDGMVERFNRTLKEHLSKVVGDYQRDWDRHIPLFLMAYRSAVHSSTGHTPSEILFGTTIRLPSEVKFGCRTMEPERPDEYVDNLKERLIDIHQRTRKNIKAASDRMKTRYDTRATTMGFKEGDLVWFYNPHRQKGLSPKLQQNWEGPYTVVKRINDVVYRIQRGVRGKLKVVHCDRLHRYNGGNENNGFNRDDQS